MDKTVKSLKSEVNRELSSKDIRGNESFKKFDINDLVSSYGKDPNILSIWYSQLYGDILRFIKEILLSPVDSEEIKKEEAYNTLESGIKSLIDSVESSDKSTQQLLNLRDRFKKFQESETDELTIVLKIHQTETEVGYINTFFSDSVVSVNLSENPSNAEESALRSYKDEIVDAFCGYENGPNSRFMRELHISLKKTLDEDICSIDIQSRRMKYTRLEKLFRILGLSPPYKTEPAKKL